MGIKKLVIPVLANKISSKFEPKENTQLIDDRIQRLEKFIGSNQNGMNEIDENPQNTLTSSHQPTSEGVAVSCIACARSHIAAVSASLKEAIRFCRDEGIMNPEVQTRLSTSEEEICALERYDWSAEKIVNSPKDEQEIINNFLPQIRELRQNISTIENLPDLVQAAASAGRIHNEYRIAILKAKNK